MPWDLIIIVVLGVGWLLKERLKAWEEKKAEENDTGYGDNDRWDKDIR